jgi:anti-anti-sigma factor
MSSAELITLVGDVDIEQVDVLRAAHDAFQRSAATSVIVDLSQVTFFGSEGCGLIAWLHRLAEQRGGTVTVRNASPATMRVIEVCGLRDAIREELTSPTAPAPERPRQGDPV